MDPKIRPPNPALPYRDDCWSEGETSALVDAWGSRYIELNRGNLRQKHWQEVADHVNSRPGAAGRPTRTDVQCKNRIDTLKKKYKVEKVKNSVSGSSTWPFFERLDFLIRATVTPSGEVVVKKQPMVPLMPSMSMSSNSSPPLALPLPFTRKTGQPLPTAFAAAAEVKKEQKERPLADVTVDDLILRRAQAAAAAAEEEEEEDEEEFEEVEAGSPSGSSSRSGFKRGGEGARELAGAIMRFAEIYERVEVAKQRQMMELEKQRMEFTKEIEFRRMQMFVDSQVQLEKFKRAKRSDPGHNTFGNKEISFEFDIRLWDYSHILGF